MSFRRVTALSGGVGGARLVHGLDRALGPGALSVIVNTGDDFVHWGLNVSPDLDTVMYTLADLAHEERGWGLAEESFATLEMVRHYGGADWFALGDRDLATHILRTAALRRGQTLSAITERLAAALGVAARILPMSDAPRRTVIDTSDGRSLAFQDWFVRERAEPVARRVRFEGATTPAPNVLRAIAEADLVVIGPSNPYVSIDPILTLDGVRSLLATRRVVAMSPIVGGRAVKGPLARMMPALGGGAPSAGAIARHYGDLVAAMVVERGDGATVVDAPVLETSTVMKTRADSLRLARELLDFAAALG